MWSEWEYGAGEWVWVVLVGSLPWWCPVLGWAVMWGWAVHGAVLLAVTTSGWARRLVAKVLLQSTKWRWWSQQVPGGLHLGLVLGTRSLLTVILHQAKEKNELGAFADALEVASNIYRLRYDRHGPVLTIIEALMNTLRLWRIYRRADRVHTIVCPNCRWIRRIQGPWMLQMPKFLEKFVQEWRQYRTEDRTSLRRILMTWITTNRFPLQIITQWNETTEQKLKKNAELLKDAIANKEVFPSAFTETLVSNVTNEFFNPTPPEESQARRSFLASLQFTWSSRTAERGLLQAALLLQQEWLVPDFLDRLILLLSRRPDIFVFAASEIYFFIGGQMQYLMDTEIKFRSAVLRAGRRTGRHFQDGSQHSIPAGVPLNEGLPAVLGLSLDDFFSRCVCKAADLQDDCFQVKASELLQDPLSFLLFRDTGVLDRLARLHRRLDEPGEWRICSCQVWDWTTDMSWQVEEVQEGIVQLIERASVALSARPSSVCQKLNRLAFSQPRRLRISFD